MKHPPMMSCGHAANATDGKGNPTCAICGSFGASPVVVEDPQLDNRLARCASCGVKVQSDQGLAFFAHKPDKTYDSFYCGCQGWD